MSERAQEDWGRPSEAQCLRTGRKSSVNDTHIVKPEPKLK